MGKENGPLLNNVWGNWCRKSNLRLIKQISRQKIVMAVAYSAISIVCNNSIDSDI